MKLLVYNNGNGKGLARIKSLKPTVNNRFIAIDADGFEIDLVKEDILEIEEIIKPAKAKREPAAKKQVFTFYAALWTKAGDLRTKHNIKVKATDEAEAWDKINERYGDKAYDIGRE